MTIVLTNPSEYDYTMWKGGHLFYEAYWPFEKTIKPFKFSVRAKKFREAIRAVPQHLRQDITHPVQFTFMRGDNQEMYIKDWKVLE